MLRILMDHIANNGDARDEQYMDSKVKYLTEAI